MLYIEYEEYLSKYHEAQKRYNEILNEKEELFSRTQPQAIKYDKEAVSGGKPGNTFDEYLIIKEKKNIDDRLEEIRSILDDRERLLKLKEQELRLSKDGYDKVYRCRYLDHLTIDKTSRIAIYSRSQVFNILKEIKKNIKNITLD